MKIVIDARTMGSKPSGVGIYAFYYLKELIKTDHKLILLTDIETSSEMKYMRDHGTEIISYGTRIYRSIQVFRYFAFVREQLQRLQPDLFWEPNILIPRKLSGYKGITMITIHDMFPVTHVQYFGWKYGIYFRLMLQKTIGRTDIVLYNSVETKEESEKYFPDLKKKKDFVLYVIVPRIEAAQDFEKIQDLTPGPAEKDYFLYVGNMEKRKGVDLLLEAYEVYRKKGGTKNLILAGKSREKDVDEKVVSVTSRYDSAAYYGYVNEEEKQRLYQNCSCFLFPSMAEGFGICILEAMNYYKPIIASDLSIFQEIVGDCIHYFTIDGNRAAQIDSLSEAMLRYQTDTMIDRLAYDKVMERYDPEQLGRQMADMLQSLQMSTANNLIEE